MIGRILLMPYRLYFGLRYLTPSFARLFRWIWSSREIDNLTYDLTDLNVQYLIACVAAITHQPISMIRSYVKEIMEDEELRAHLKRYTQEAPERYIADTDVTYGRRIGWYVLTRTLKPKIVVETGTNKGLGSCVITAALRRNSKEGRAGYLYSTDIDPKAGYLFKPPYAEFGKLLYGDSIESLKTLDVSIDLFINDSDHSQEYEMKEYEIVKTKLSPGALIIGDNAHCSPKLWEFSQQTNRNFLFFQEQPREHWYPGAGMGISYII